MIQYSVTQYSVIQCSLVQYTCSVIQYSDSIQCDTIQFSTIQCDTMQSSTVYTVPCSVIQTVTRYYGVQGRMQGFFHSVCEAIALSRSRGIMGILAHFSKRPPTNPTNPLPSLVPPCGRVRSAREATVHHYASEFFPNSIFRFPQILFLDFSKFYFPKFYFPNSNAFLFLDFQNRKRQFYFPKKATPFFPTTLPQPSLPPTLSECLPIACRVFFTSLPVCFALLYCPIE